MSNKIGSLQLYVEPALQVKKGEFKKTLEMVSKDDAANLKLFYFIFGQWDTGAHNIIISNKSESSESHVVQSNDIQSNDNHSNDIQSSDNHSNNIQLNAIDNSGIRNRQQVKYGELPFVRIAYSDTLNTDDWHRPFPFQKIQIMKNIDKNEMSDFRKHFSEDVYERLLKIQKPIHYVIYQNSLWIQYHQGESDFILSHTNYYPPDTIATLKGLTKKELKRIFKGAKGCDFLTDAYLESILERRDQVIAAYEKS